MKTEELQIPELAKRVVVESGITTLYPPQEDAVKAGALEGRNLVLASPTASGKTLVAELCAIKHILEHDGKVLYLTPLRALASEKYDEFQKYSKIVKRRGQKVGIGISTGDYDSSDDWMGKYDLIITTNEKADSLLRHRARWMSEVSLVVADEIHLLNDAGRGPTLEVVLARLMQINPKAQFLALSATIKNAEEIAEWLKAESITTEWRPVKLREGVYFSNEVEFNDGSSYRVDDVHRNPSINMAMHVVKQHSQALIFAETRKMSIALAGKAAAVVKKTLSVPEQRALKAVSDEILRSGERTRLSDTLAFIVKDGAAFHHAGLLSHHRKIVEDAFRKGKIKIIVATPTLAAGVNLPARLVAIHSYERYEPGYGNYPITVLEYKQMASRAGRPKYDEIGEAVLIASTDDEQSYLMDTYVLSEPEKIWSKMAVERVLRSHVLATVAAGFAHTEQGVFEFFDKTFYSFQYGSDAIREVIGKILKFLLDEKMIRFHGDKVFATPFGGRTSELYIDPISAVKIRDGLANRAGTTTDLSFLHLICHTPDMNPKFYPRRGEMDDLEAYLGTHQDEFMFELPDEWEDRIVYEEFLAELKGAMVLESWINEVSEDAIIENHSVEPGDLFRTVDNADWLLHASHELATLFNHKDLIPALSMLRERVENGVKLELLPLIRLEGVGRVRGRLLFNSGFRKIEDLKKAQISQLTSIPLIGPQVARRIKEQVGGLVKPEDWKRLRGRESGEQRTLTDTY